MLICLYGIVYLPLRNRTFLVSLDLLFRNFLPCISSRGFFNVTLCAIKWITLLEKYPNTDQKKLCIWTLFTQCQNVSNMSNDGEFDYSASIPNGKAPDYPELPSRSTKSEINEILLLAKIKNLTELCTNIKETEEKAINDISSLVDDAILMSKQK